MQCWFDCAFRGKSACCLMNTPAGDIRRGPHPALGKAMAADEVQNASLIAGKVKQGGALALL